MLTLLLLAQAATATPAPAPKLSDAQSQAIVQAIQEVDMAAQLLQAMQRLDAAQKALASRVADATATCGAQPVRGVNGAISCPEVKK